MTSSSSLSVITFLLFVHLSLSRESSPQIPNVTKSLFTLVRTIHTGSKGEGSRFRLTLTPRKVLIQRRKKNNKTVAPRIKVKIVRSYVDKKMMFGNDLTIDNGEIEVENGRRKHIVSGVVVLLAPQVRARGLGLCNKTCQQYGLTVNDIIKGPISVSSRSCFLHALQYSSYLPLCCVTRLKSTTSLFRVSAPFIRRGLRRHGCRRHQAPDTAKRKLDPLL
ncbi:hypothetical protein YC2023_013542 [Brassica napus]